jgi:anthranilate phosphoribosyltransferase
VNTTPLRAALLALANRQSLSESQTEDVFGIVMSGEATPAQIGALLLGLRTKGETADEIAGAARALRNAMVHVESTLPNLVDTCGTGGGTVSTFNISTVAAFVAAGAGAAVPKHGNRSYTSRCGSADVLEALGVRIVLDAPSAARVLGDARVVFLFAPAFHPAMKHVGPIRRELGTPSVMNLVGPLANPASVRRQVVGVFERDRAAVVAEALLRLGSEHALVVHGRVGMDEISPVGVTDVWEIRDGTVRTWEIDPERYRLGIPDVNVLKGDEPAKNAERLERILGNGAARDREGDAAGLAAVLLNAGAAIYVAGIASSYAEGIGRAREVVASGAARAALDRLRKATASISG